MARGQPCFIARIPFHHFHPFIASPRTHQQLFPAPCQATHRVAMFEQTRRKATADISGCAGDEDNGQRM